jgi:hypothetical protein
MPKNPKILKSKPNDVLRSMGNNLSLYVGPNDELYILDQLGNLDLVQNYVDGGTSASPIVSKVVYCTLAEIGATSPTQSDILELMETWVNDQEITKLPNEDYIFVLTSNPPPETNFDVEADDWANGGITNEASFISFLEGQGATNIVVTEFSLVDGRLQCNLSFDGTTEFELSGLGITKINNVSSLINLTYLYLNGNQISTIENLSTLINLIDLNLSNNQITAIDNLSTLINLTYLDLSYNQISKIENLSTLVNLTVLYLSDNQISKIENLSTLINLTSLDLRGNQINKFDENVLLSTNLVFFDLIQNNFTTSDYTNAEAWANNQPVFTNPYEIYFNGNPDSPIGTSFADILSTKNATLQY